MGAARRCVVCGARLPVESSGRRRYCSDACRSRARRRRGRVARREALAAVVISAEAAVLLESLATRQARIAAWTRCPQCGVLVWAGVKRRADAVYCSARCRTRAWRSRRDRGASDPGCGDA
ncbi:DUF2116 family Zn-ribbon domain-containing protein [Nonomuraea angiospora]